jgi:uncharacterized protein with ParB-like and HNH nuclease domain
MQGKKFIIPDYQRPYKWDIEKCETLWNDIESFSQSEALTGADYFLGTIVSFINDEKNSEIIDGQQRITSFFLLLRSFYRKLEDMKEDEDVIGLKNQLAPCIWDINELSQKVSDKTKIHIASEVATEEDNQVFHSILESGYESFPYFVAILNKESHVFSSSCWNVGNAKPGSCALGHLPYFNRNPRGVI